MSGILSAANGTRKSRLQIISYMEKRSMRKIILWMAALTIAAPSLPLAVVHAQAKEDASATKADAAKAEQFKPEQQASKGSVTVGGAVINYDAYAGTLVVHPKGWDDVPQNADKDEKNQPAEASMFYVAYFKSDKENTQRPITFLYNCGPGSSTVWLHMGAFGPRRVVTADDSHTPAAPYSVVNNDYSLLDVSDLVFVDAPGTGFSRIAGKRFTAWMRMRRRSQISSRNFWGNMGAGIRRNICLAKAMGLRDRRFF